MIGTLANVAAIVTGSLIGVLIKSRLNQRYTNIFFQAAGLFTILIGITMAIQTERLVVIGASLVAGALLGEWMRLSERVQKWADRVKVRFKMRDEKFTEGLLTAFLLYCVGAMAILGPLEEGITGKTSSLLLTKAMMDGVSSIMFASVFGWGVLFSAVPLLICQGSITLFAMLIGHTVSPELVTEISALGGLLLVALGLNILKIKEINVVNMLPSMVVLYAILKISALL
jgi:uncharacterized membrane protein YqgA involved in biofilm formation